MSRWCISNKSMPRGQLADVKRFISGPERLAARSVTIPIESDLQGAADVAGGLAGDQVRSFEMWWDAAESRLRFVIIADERDADDFERAFQVMYPNAAFDGMSETVPAWFDRGSAEYRVFDVGTRHGHYATVFDEQGARSLITGMASAVQSSYHAWIQFVFVRFDCTPFLRTHMARLDGRFAEINRGDYTSWGDEITGRKPRRHPELGYDLTSNYKGLKKHVTSKMQGAHLVMSIRGLMQDGDGDGRDVDLPFDKVSALSVDDINSAYEHLTKFRYRYDRFFSDTKKSRVRVPGPRGAYDHRICIFESRHLPDPDRYFGRATSQYFDKGWWGLRGYQARRPLPFLILNPAEAPLFVHLPNPSTPNIYTTRGVRLPSKPSEKTGAGVGFFDSLDGPGQPGPAPEDAAPEDAARDAGIS